MNVDRLFLEFTGRISRSGYWFGFATIVLVFGLGRFAIKEAMGEGTDGSDFAVLLCTLQSVAPLTTVTVKRLNHRTRPRWIGYTAGARTVIMMAASHFGWFGDFADFSPIEHVVYWSLLPVSLFAHRGRSIPPARSWC